MREKSTAREQIGGALSGVYNKARRGRHNVCVFIRTRKEQLERKGSTFLLHLPWKPMPPYIAEVQAAEWTSQRIRDAFRTNNFRVRDWPLTQHLEKQVPADRVFFSPQLSKLFGIQYKARYRNGEDFWPLDKTQHAVLQRYPWIFYCCSELREVTESGAALYFARFYRSHFEYEPRLYTKAMYRGGRPYFRWGSFYMALRECRVGLKVRAHPDLRRALLSFTGKARVREVVQMEEFLLVDFVKRTVFAERLF